MKIVQRYLAISLTLCVIGALYLSFREIALPETSRIDRTLTEGEPLQEPSDRPAFTAFLAVADPGTAAHAQGLPGDEVGPVG